jgi:hypothetical protein
MIRQNRGQTENSNSSFPFNKVFHRWSGGARNKPTVPESCHGYTLELAASVQSSKLSLSRTPLKIPEPVVLYVRSRSKVGPPIRGEPRLRYVRCRTGGLAVIVHAMRDGTMDPLVGTPNLVRGEPALASKIGPVMRKTGRQRSASRKDGGGSKSRV